MHICLFGVRYRPDADFDELGRINQGLLKELGDTPGVVGYHIYAAADGEKLGLVRFASEESLLAWAQNEVHRGTFSRSREFFAEFWIQNVETVREYEWIDGRRSEHELTDRFRNSDMNVVLPFLPAAA